MRTRGSLLTNNIPVYKVEPRCTDKVLFNSLKKKVPSGTRDGKPPWLVVTYQRPRDK